MLIEAYSALAVDLAHRMRVPTGALAMTEDLESVALVGLIQAIDRFVPDRGVPFEAFAALRIRGAILDELRLIDDLSRAERRLADEHPESSRPTLSLDRLLAEGWAAHADGAIDDRVEIAEMRLLIEHAIRRLPDRQRELLSRYYGDSLTLREAAVTMGISEARASQLHGRAIENLRRALAGAAAAA